MRMDTREGLGESGVQLLDVTEMVIKQQLNKFCSKSREEPSINSQTEV